MSFAAGAFSNLALGYRASNLFLGAGANVDKAAVLIKGVVGFQHQAIGTELGATERLIDKNLSGFSTFGGGGAAGLNYLA